MKIKYFVLLTICSTVCALGCACDKGSQPDGDSSSIAQSSSSEMGSSDSSFDEEPIVKDPIISVNHSAVTFAVGEEFRLIADSENVENPAFVWSLDGDADETVVSLAQTGNTAVITALKTGETKLVVSMEYEGHVYFKTVDVTVTDQSEVSLILSNNVGFDNDGYHVRLSTFPTDSGDVQSIVPIVSVYKNNKTVSANSYTFTWRSENTDVVTLEGNKFVAKGEGTALMQGVCEMDGKTYTVSVSVDVYRPTITLNESFVVEVENLVSQPIQAEIKGIVKDVLYNRESVGSYDAQSKLLTFDKAKMPTKASLMGEACPLTIVTSSANYVLSIDLYTKIIRDKVDFDGMAEIAKKAVADAAIWDGYFVLGEDIVYDGLFDSKIADTGSLWDAVGGAWSNGGLYGFRGVFDGKGHNIEGVRIDHGSSMGSIFGVLHIDGVVKNVSFTKASVAANSSFVCHAGGGTVENIYIQYDSVGQGTQNYQSNGSINEHCGSFFSFKEPTATANVSNCVIDVTQAAFNYNTSIKLVGSEYTAIKNVFVIGGTEALRKASNATLSFPLIVEFMDDTNVQNRYNKFDENFWSKANGVPVSNAVYENISGNEVNFTEELSHLLAGTSYQFRLDNKYVTITSDNDGVIVNGDVVTVSKTAQNGEKVSITATSVFDPLKKDVFECSILSVSEENLVDLTQTNDLAFYDMTLDKVYFADVKDEIKDEVLYFVNPDYSAVSYATENDGTQTLIAVTANKLYKFNYQSVTKVIEKAEDLHYVRRDYTVSSYGNKGCYDGVLTGTFVLVNDIDCTGLELANSGKYWENSRGFAGIFDGRGYTISNLTVSENGLFGAVSKATIKNVNFAGVKLKAADQGAYVALFAPRVFNTTVENVSVEFVEYVTSEDIYHTSGLLFYETSFDNVFKDVTMDISNISGVKYLTEAYYDAETPYLSENKSTYENITVIVAAGLAEEEYPVFAYKNGKGTEEDIEAMPDGITFVKADKNEKA